MNIDFESEMLRIQNEMRGIMSEERESQNILEDAFGGIGYGIG